VVRSDEAAKLRVRARPQSTKTFKPEPEDLKVVEGYLMREIARLNERLETIRRDIQALSAR
jgi:hypothetical protein